MDGIVQKLMFQDGPTSIIYNQPPLLLSNAPSTRKKSPEELEHIFGELLVLVASNLFEEITKEEFYEDNTDLEGLLYARIAKEKL